MYPKSTENQHKPSCHLINQFKEKGYTCTQHVEKDKTILILMYANRQRYDALSLSAGNNEETSGNN
jgi:hypothetical protein